MDGHIIGSRIICGQCCVFGMLADFIKRDYVMRFACAAAVELRTSAGMRTEFSLWFNDCFIAANNNVKSLPQAGRSTGSQYLCGQSSSNGQIKRVNYAVSLVCCWPLEWCALLGIMYMCAIGRRRRKPDGASDAVAHEL